MFELCSKGPPVVITLTAKYEAFQSNSTVTLKCEVEGLDYQQLQSYHWQWKFQGREIEDTTKHKVIIHFQPPNVCQLSRGSAILDINNVSREDYGQYTCVILQFNITRAEREVSFHSFSKHFLYFDKDSTTSSIFFHSLYFTTLKKLAAAKLRLDHIKSFSLITNIIII